MTVPQSDKKWRKATRSEQQAACVELHPDGAIRDSKNQAGPQLLTSFAGLIAAVKSGSLTR